MANINQTKKVNKNKLNRIKSVSGKEENVNIHVDNLEFEVEGYELR